MDFYGLPMIPMDFYGFLWIFMDSYGFPCFCESPFVAWTAHEQDTSQVQPKSETRAQVIAVMRGCIDF
jgi:hypothetical protein